jgi:hypothetical protein
MDFGSRVRLTGSGVPRPATAKGNSDVIGPQGATGAGASLPLTTVPILVVSIWGSRNHLDTGSQLWSNQVQIDSSPRIENADMKHGIGLVDDSIDMATGNTKVNPHHAVANGVAGRENKDIVVHVRVAVLRSLV